MRGPTLNLGRQSNVYSADFYKIYCHAPYQARGAPLQMRVEQQTLSLFKGCDDNISTTDVDRPYTPLRPCVVEPNQLFVREHRTVLPVGSDARE